MAISTDELQPRKRQDPRVTDRGVDMPEQEEWQRELARRVLEMAAFSDAGEEARRKTDRIGANLYYGRHWNIQMPKSRAMLTANIAKSLIEHVVSIMTKQDPVWVVEPTEWGDPRGAQLLRAVLINFWQNDDMRMKLRRVKRLSKTTRTAAIKYVWDPQLQNGNGDVTGDVLPGWKLLLDDRAGEVENMRFIGHREVLTRTKAALLYPEAADLIFSAGSASSRSLPGLGTSPLSDPWRKVMAGPTTSTLVNGKPTISAFSSNGSARSNIEEREMVQIVEMFHVDDTMVEAEEPERDSMGAIRKEIERDKNGLPLFDEHGTEKVSHPDGFSVELPVLKVRVKELTKKVMKRVYPSLRRSTVLIPDGLLLDDCPWDGPCPYTLFADGQALEGPWVKGSILDCEDLQVAFNVSISLMMDNLRLNSLRPILAGQASNIQQNTMMVSPGEIVRVGTVSEVQPLEFPPPDPSWFQWCEFLIANMERIIGASGIMQGEAAGRVDSAAGYDILAEIGGSQIVEETQQMEDAMSKGARIVAWFAQQYYTESRAIRIEDDQGNPTSERVSSPYLIGTYHFEVETGSTMAWSESSVRQRLMAELQAGIIDKIAYWQRSNTPDWQQIKSRILTQDPRLNGAAGSPPPRTRSAHKNAGKKQPGA